MAEHVNKLVDEFNRSITYAKEAVGIGAHFTGEVDGDTRRSARNALLDAAVYAQLIGPSDPERTSSLIEAITKEWEKPNYWSPIGGMLEELGPLARLIGRLPRDKQLELLNLDLNGKIDLFNEYPPE